MKAVNRFFLLLSVVFSGACISGEQSDKRMESIEYVRNKIVVIAGKLEKNIERCTIVRSSAKLPEIDAKKLVSLGVDKASLVYGLSYLSNRNFESCEGKYRVELAYQLGVLENLGDYYDVELPPIDDIKGALIYPGNRDVEAELVFSKWSSGAKEYVLKSVGDSPFDLLKTISVNGILEK